MLIFPNENNKLDKLLINLNLFYRKLKNNIVLTPCQAVIKYTLDEDSSIKYIY